MGVVVFCFVFSPFPFRRVILGEKSGLFGFVNITTIGVFYPSLVFIVTLPEGVGFVRAG